MNMKVVNNMGRSSTEKGKQSSVSYPKAKDMMKSVKLPSKKKSKPIAEVEMQEIEAADLDVDIDDLEKELDEAEKSRNTHRDAHRSSTMKQQVNTTSVDEQLMESCAIMNAINVERESSSMMV